MPLGQCIALEATTQGRLEISSEDWAGSIRLTSGVPWGRCSAAAELAGYHPEATCSKVRAALSPYRTVLMHISAYSGIEARS